MTKSTRLRTSLSASTILAAGLLLVVAPAQAQNLPDTGNVSSVTSGLSGGAPGSTDPAFSTSGAAGAQTLRVDLKDNRTILNWGGTGFSVAAGNTVDFKDARATTGVTGRTDNIAVLNRDLSGNSSNILGTLKSDPNVAVYVINGAGIVFGPSSVTNTGTFFASTLDLTDANFFNTPTSLNFSGDGKGIVLKPGASITTTSTASSDGGRIGDLVLIGKTIAGDETGALRTLKANGGDVALIAAGGVTIQNSPGSPLSFTVNAAAREFLATEVVNVNADISGRNVTVATLKGNGGNLGQSIWLDGTVTATGAAVTDRGVVLTAALDAPGVAFTTTGTSDVNGTMQLNSLVNSAKDINVKYGGAYIEVRNSWTAAGKLDFDVNGMNGYNSAFTAAQMVLPGTMNTAGKVTVTNGDLTFHTSTIGGVSLNGGADVSGNIIANVFGFSAGDLVVGGGINIQTGDASFSKVNAAGSISVIAQGDFTSTGALTSTNGGITVSSGRHIVGADFDAEAGSLSLNGLLGLKANTVFGRDGVSLISDGYSGASSIYDNGRIRIGSVSTGATGDLYIRSLQLFNFTDGRVTSLVAGHDVNITTSFVDAGLIKATTGSVTLNANGVSTTYGTYITVDNLVAGNGISGTALGGLNIINADAGTGSLQLAANNGAVILGSLTVPSAISAGGNITINATGAALLRASVTAGGNLSATGSTVGLGATAFPAYQIKARGTVDLTATSSLITGNGSVSIQSNSDGIGTEALTLNSAAGVAFANGTALIGGTARQSDVRIRSAANSAVTLSSVSARGLLGATGTDPFTNGLTRNATVGLSGGAVDLINSLYISGTFLVLGGTINVSNGDIDLHAANGAFSSTPPLLTASRDVTVALSDPAATLTLGNVTGGRNVSISANSINLGQVEGTTGAVRLTGGSVTATAISSGSDFRVDSSSFVLPGNINVGGNVQLNSTGDGTLGGTVLAGGDLTVDAAGLLSLGYALKPTDIEAAGAVTLKGGTIQDVTSLTTTALVRSNKDGVGAEALTLEATGDILLSRVSLQGGTNRQSDVQVRFSIGRNLGFGDVKARSLLGASGNAAFANGIANAGSAAFDGTVDLVNTFSVIAPTIVTNNVAVGNGDIVLQSNSSPFAVNGALVASGDISINSGLQTITISNAGTLSGRNVTLSTGGTFANSRGADAIAASGHWVIYSDNPTDDMFGGLDSGNTAYWNSTIGTRAPGSVTGNRYVFAYQPTLTVGTQDFSKVYGTDLTGTGSTGIPFAVTGYQVGVAGAFLGDSAASALSGQPLITSAGFAARATVAGGPYSQTIAQGSLVSNTGYAITIAPSTGMVTVTPKALTASVIADNKTYDGTTAATGTVTLNGVVTGDTVGTSGTTFSFGDKNAGTGKAVAVAGTTLTGADMGNYTLTVPASVLADIFKKALTVTVTANGKIYDGTTATTGTVTIGGVIAGDTVGTSGSTFAFADKNAGTGKTVNVTGTTLTGADASNYSITIPANVLADILKKAITADVVVNNKTYDGTTTGSGSVTLNGVVSGDAVGTNGTTFIFNDKNAGTGKTVAVAGTTLTGADAGNYTVTVPASALADILKKALTATVAANGKTYDGSTDGSGTVTLNGVVSGDAVGTSGTTFTFGDKNAGTGKTVNVAGTTLTGADAGNYSLTVPASVLADILKKALTATVVANNKTYDGTTAGSGTVTLNGVVSGDAVGTGGTSFTFGDKNAGTGKTVTVAGTTLTGTDAGNYTLTVPASALADILKKALTATITADGKTYDGTTAATGTVVLNGVIAGETVGSTGTTFAFADKNAGTGKTVNVSGTTLTGADAGNYSLTVPASVLADILKKAITASVVVNSKTYDGTTTGTGTVTLNGVLAGDTVGTSATTFTFADKNAGAAKTVTVAGTTLTGADGGNYSVTVPASALADILKKVIAASVTVTSKTYDGTTAGTGTVTLNGVVAGDNVTTSGTTFTYADKNAGTGKAVAVAGTTVGGADAGNYTITIPASALGDILKRALSVTADDASKVQNDPDPALTYTLTSGSLVTGDAFSGGVARDGGENPGTYAIKIGTLSAGDNYTITFTPGTFTINLPLGSEGLQPALKAQPLPSQIGTGVGASSGSSVSLDTGAVCGDDKNCTTGKPAQ